MHQLFKTFVYECVVPSVRVWVLWLIICLWYLMSSPHLTFPLRKTRTPRRCTTSASIRGQEEGKETYCRAARCLHHHCVLSSYIQILCPIFKKNSDNKTSISGKKKVYFISGFYVYRLPKYCCSIQKIRRLFTTEDFEHRKAIYFQYFTQKAWTTSS